MPLSRRGVIGLSAAPLFAAERVKRPVLDSEPWRLFGMPDMGELAGPDPKKQHIVDHGLFRMPNGKWRLWACLRGLAVGRVLYGWEGDSLERGGWRELGVVARMAPEWGEGSGRGGGETIQAPFFLQRDGVYHLFYNSRGVRLMTSREGEKFERFDLGGTRRNLLYPDGGRDVMVLEIDGVFHAYSTVSTTDRQGYIVLKTSKDLREWSDLKIVCRGGRGGSGPVSAESPFVVALGKTYYLFRASSDEPVTFVYASEDPTYFGVNDDRNLVAELPLKAPEVVRDGEKWFITDLGDFQGVMVRRLRWV